MKTYTVYFEPFGRRGKCRSDRSLLDCARRLGIGINNVCGGVGKCQACKIQVISGTVSAPTSHELKAFSPQEMKGGWRLACQTHPTSNGKVSIPPESMTTLQRTQVEGLEIAVRLEPLIRTYQVKLSPPSLSEPLADAEALLKTLRQQHKVRCSKVDIDVLHNLSPQLRSWDWECQAAVRNDEIIAISSPESRQVGLAIDLGTTKIASYLIDLSNGKTLAAKGIINPQASYGEDIISRISAVVSSPEEGIKLQKLVVGAINKLAAELCAEVDAKVEEIIEAVIVGNTAMHHLLLGLPVKQLALSPFVPAVSDALDIKARDLGLNLAPGAYIHLLPNIAGFVGADHVAMLLATEAWQAEAPTIAIDIGTNTEVSFINKRKISAVSCASGPAFEGGHIKNGMWAARGAIERVQITEDSIQYQTIDDALPVGICGSGILDAMAQLYQAGVIGSDGRMKDNHPRVRTRKEQREFVLVSEAERNGLPAIVITQQDVRELQLAKAAIRTGIQVLLEANGCAEEEIKQIIIAGAFGSYIDIKSVIAIGMLPALPLERFRQVGNAAGMGAKLALISVSQRARAQKISSRIHYIELASFPNFRQTFIQANYLGQYRIEHGKRKEIA
ncbi:MAG: DUF4445 domain-containing protein [Chloroflexi bacterium]|nr:DUF4445 domain-containing protein [Chloroflexota bacterium]